MSWEESLQLPRRRMSLFTMKRCLPLPPCLRWRGPPWWRASLSVWMTWRYQAKTSSTSWCPWRLTRHPPCTGESRLVVFRLMDGRDCKVTGIYCFYLLCFETILIFPPPVRRRPNCCGRWAQQSKRRTMSWRLTLPPCSWTALLWTPTQMLCPR